MTEPPKFRGFPLSRLPTLVRIEVLSTIDPLGLFALSLTSRKVQADVKESKTWKQIRIVITFDEYRLTFGLRLVDPFYNIEIFQMTEQQYFLEDSTFSGITHKLNIGHMSYETFWDDPKEAIETIGDHLLGMCEKRSIDIMINKNPIALIVPVVDLLSIRGFTKVSNLSVWGYSQSIEEIYQLFENLEVSESFSTHVEELDFERIHHRLKDINKLTIERNPLINIHHISVMNPQIVTIFLVTTLMSEDFNQLLKNWVDGSACSRLKWFRVTSYNMFNKEVMLGGVLGIEQPPTEVRNYFANRKETIRGGFDVERVDGTRCTVVTAARAFVMYVWPDMQGKG